MSALFQLLHISPEVLLVWILAASQRGIFYAALDIHLLPDSDFLKCPYWSHESVISQIRDIRA